MHRSDVKNVFDRAVDCGAVRNTAFEAEWDVAGNCYAPVAVLLHKKPTNGMVYRRRVHPEDWWADDFPGNVIGAIKTSKYFEENLGPYAVIMHTRCRKCDACLKWRRNAWARRAIGEFAIASRVWFMTLTLSPEWHSYFGALAARKCNGEPFEARSHGEQFLRRHVEIGREFTKMFKRLRKAGHEFRYFLVAEAHESGLPHYHMLVYELGAPIGKRDLQAAWQFGFTKCELAKDTKAVWYAAKYLGKNSVSRVRASLNFGRLGSALAVGLLKQSVRATDPLGDNIASELAKLAGIMQGGVRGADKDPPQHVATVTELRGENDV